MSHRTVDPSSGGRSFARLPKAAEARCDHCRKVLRPDRVIPGPPGLQFDSIQCRDEYRDRAQLRALENAMRVRRSRLKTMTIARAGAAYRTLGGREWRLVERLLRAVL